MYFWYTLIFLLGRTFILALYAAEINEESKKPLTIFRKIKREYWCPEVSTDSYTKPTIYIQFKTKRLLICYSKNSVIFNQVKTYLKNHEYYKT